MQRPPTCCSRATLPPVFDRRDRYAPSLPPACHPQEDYRPQIEEMSFLQDVERNDGRLMLFQLPALLPVAQQVGWLMRAECRLGVWWCPCARSKMEHGQPELSLARLCSLLRLTLCCPSPRLSPTQAPGANGAGPSVAASRPASLKEVPSSKIGKLLVFESGKVKLQVGLTCNSCCVADSSCWLACSSC